ncbi:MAG: hypothetical protein C0617_15810 [Desulfuromonas sp.]|uniref:sulfotransferase family protein n=1 Tax=Desulfuromonas sp. TaxID=892 RepID=UPI000CAAA7FD|nr:sulfotransferase [Desulfuromonas sp.]PLX81802.1 MAG: hypothetical protein C0617_15810 [Desulfuromonas sp.]
MKKAPLPNFLIIGVPKAGTTSLDHYLRQHPQIFLPQKKELHYFSYRFLKESLAGPGDLGSLQSVCSTFREYENCFCNAGEVSAIGEISPSYFYFREVAHEMRKRLGNIKVVISLRDPLKRAYSNYMHLVRDDRETLSFYNALCEEEQRKAKGWSDFWRYSEHSLYSQNLRFFMDVFGPENVKVVIFEEMVRDTEGSLRDLFKFLGVDDSVSVQSGKVLNRSGTLRFRFVKNVIYEDSPLKKLFKKVVPKELRTSLKCYLENLNLIPAEDIEIDAVNLLASRFESDRASLEELLGRKIDCWHF